MLEKAPAKLMLSEAYIDSVLEQCEPLNIGVVYKAECFFQIIEKSEHAQTNLPRMAILTQHTELATELDIARAGAYANNLAS